MGNRIESESTRNTSRELEISVGNRDDEGTCGWDGVIVGGTCVDGCEGVGGGVGTGVGVGVMDES